MRQEAEQAKPIVDGDQHHAGAGQGFAVVQRHAASALDEAAAVNPHHHRHFGVACASRRPDVQIQAVFALRDRPLGVEALRRGRLHAGLGKRRGVAFPLPRRGGRGRLPAQLADRRRREGDALERHHGVVGGIRPAHIAVGHCHHLADEGRRHRRRLRLRLARGRFRRRAAAKPRRRQQDDRSRGAGAAPKRFRGGLEIPVVGLHSLLPNLRVRVNELAARRASGR